MSRILDGIAHVSFARGGLFVPARTPYDRQILVEHIADRVRSEGRVQVLVDDRRWIVQATPPNAGRCGRCGGALLVSCRSLSASGALCLKCALVPAQEHNAGAKVEEVGADSPAPPALPHYRFGRVTVSHR